MRNIVKILGLFLLGFIALVTLLWLLRAPVAGAIAESYLSSQGVVASVRISQLDSSGMRASVTLGDPHAPAFATDEIELLFNPALWLPQVTNVHLKGATIRMRADADGITVPSLQNWIKTLQERSSTGSQSRFISDRPDIQVDGARVLLGTPYGVLPLDGSVLMRKGDLVLAQVHSEPAILSSRFGKLKIRQAAFEVRPGTSGRALEAQLSFRLEPEASAPQWRSGDIRVSFIAPGYHWSAATGRTGVSIPSAHLRIETPEWQTAKARIRDLEADFTLAHLQAGLSNGKVSGKGEIGSLMRAKLNGDDARNLLRTLPLIGTEPSWTEELVRASGDVRLSLGARVSQTAGNLAFRLTSPAWLSGPNGSGLRFNALSLSFSRGTIEGAVDAHLFGHDLPAVNLRSNRFVWTTRDGEVFSQGDAALDARFDYRNFKGGRLAAVGRFSLAHGRFSASLAQCADASIRTIRYGRHSTAGRLSGRLCGTQSGPIFQSLPTGWNVAGDARDLSLRLPDQQVRIERGRASLIIAARNGLPLSGKFSIAGMRLSDSSPSLRFEPVQGFGHIVLGRNILTGRIAFAASRLRQPVASVTLRHDLRTGRGRAVIDAAELQFTPDGLQPAQLSPALASLRHVDGHARFAGEISWKPGSVASDGSLTIEEMSFTSPLGRAHALKSAIAFNSLLPPTTAPGQRISVDRIEWALPMTNSNAVFALVPGEVHVDETNTNIAGGTLSLDPLIFLESTGQVRHGTARFSGIDFAELIAASNLGAKIKVTGKLSGRIPFSAGPEGLRITAGHLATVGPARLSIDRSLWTSGGANLTAVQDFAYQALENLAVDSMTAEINSVANGRLQVVFHVKGRSDPPVAQEASVGLMELLNGKALEKPIPLPSGTPIDLTLDTSLNFDALLQSYRDAWSKTLATGAKR